MKRKTGIYKESIAGEETVRAFVPYNLPPARPVLQFDSDLAELLNSAQISIEKLIIAAAMVPSPEWYLYGFVRKEAVITSQIEGTQATLEDVVKYEAGEPSDKPDDVEEVCNYIAALNYARNELAKPKGLPVCVRLITEIHKRLMDGVRGADKQPGELRRSQNWVGGTRPGNARFVPPPPKEAGKTLGELEKFIHKNDKFHPLVKAGLVHAQFETIHPFLDGNGRIGRLLISLLLEQWGLLPAPMLYISLAFKRNRSSYYDSLSRIRSDGDWEGWISFFLQAVKEATDDGVESATNLFKVVSTDRDILMKNNKTTMNAVKLFEMLPEHPVVTLPYASKLMDASRPTVVSAISFLHKLGVLREITGKKRDRVFTYFKYLDILRKD